MIIVFGKNGQVGKELNHFKETLGFNKFEADFTKPNDCINLIDKYKPDAIINAAAYTSVDEAEYDKELAEIINGNTPGKIAKFCSNLKIPFVQISTDSVFDGSGKKKWKSSDKTNPINVYGRSKLKGENLILQSGATYVILRTSWIFSKNGNNFVKKILTLSEEKKSFKVVNDQFGGPTNAFDVAKACLEVTKQLIKDNDKQGIYHFSGKPDVSRFSLASKILKIAGKSTKIQPMLTENFITPAKRPLNSRLDCSLLKKTFNISRPLWHQSLKKVIMDIKSI